jgi:hypothetical protein
MIAMYACCDLSLTEALADPLIRAVMEADGVDPRKLAAELREMAAALNLFDRPPVITAEARGKRACSFTKLTWRSSPRHAQEAPAP